MTPLTRLRIEKAATDCGFEREAVALKDGRIELRSSHFPEVLIVGVSGQEFSVASSLDTLLDGADGMTIPAGNIDELYRILRRAGAIARTMPNRVADQFRQAVQGLPTSTEAERLAVQRVGQDIFRNALLDYWQGRCCVTNLAVPGLLRASHIKPWAKCADDDERLDVFNGLLLAPHVDALFDAGWISFSDQGSLMVSEALPAEARQQLGISSDWSLQGLKQAHIRYLQFHRNFILMQ